jgi:hypothetical protein
MTCKSLSIVMYEVCHVGLVDYFLRTKRMLYSLLYFLLFINVIPITIQAIRCRTRCPFVLLTFNVTKWDDMCPQVDERDNAHCSLVMQLDFDKLIGSGLIMIEDSRPTNSLKIETKFDMYSNSTISTIIYTCDMSDNCAWEFLRQLLGPDLTAFDALAVRNKLSYLLINDGPLNSTEIQCVNNRCAYNSYCQGYFMENISSQSTHYQIENHLPCVDMSTTPSMVIIQRTYVSFQTRKTNMTLLCNQNDCNRNQTIMAAYRIYDDEFLLPLNYSFIDSNTSLTTTTPTSLALSSYEVRVFRCITSVSFLFFVDFLRLSSIAI